MYRRSLFSSSFGSSSSWFDSVRPVFLHQLAKARRDSRRVLTVLGERPSFQYAMSTRSTGSRVRSLSREARVSAKIHSRCICRSRMSFALTPRPRQCWRYSRMCCARGFLFSSANRSWRGSTTPSLRSATSASSLLAIRSAARRSVVRLDFSRRRPCWSKNWISHGPDPFRLKTLAMASPFLAREVDRCRRKAGTPGRARTCDPSFRKAVLYPD